MKRRELIARLQQMGCVLTRHGGRHDWYHNPKNRESQPVPRHAEINEYLANHIIKKLS
ncbi:MAG: type II toxin-antitoxin system HicA family toxin [Chromatiaceae bacterium]